MLEALIITFREGLEAFLIVAITLAYLNKTGRKHLNKAVFAGLGAAVLLCATVSWRIQDLVQEPLMEGLMALVAGLLVASLTYMMLRTAKNFSHVMTRTLEDHAAKDGMMALAGVFFFTILMIAREGMELALMLGTMTSYLSLSTLIAGTVLGFGVVGLIGYLWVTQSSKINLKLFMQVTGIFLILFAAHLFVFGIHEIAEINALPLLSDDMNYSIHIATEPFGHDSVYAQLVTYSLLLIPCGWLGFAFLRDKMAIAA